MEATPPPPPISLWLLFLASLVGVTGGCGEAGCCPPLRAVGDTDCLGCGGGRSCMLVAPPGGLLALVGLRPVEALFITLGLLVPIWFAIADDGFSSACGCWLLPKNGGCCVGAAGEAGAGQAGDEAPGVVGRAPAGVTPRPRGLGGPTPTGLESWPPPAVGPSPRGLGGPGGGPPMVCCGGRSSIVRLLLIGLAGVLPVLSNSSPPIGTEIKKNIIKYT